jgi:hypothetical protein
MGAQRLYVISIPPDDAAGAPVRLDVEDRRGWPWPSMRSTLRGTSVGSGRHTLDRIEGGLRLRSAERDLEPTSLERMAALPLWPHWPGFAGNWALGVVAWWILLTISLIPRWARSVRWDRLGCCPSCGYQLFGEEVVQCPECGRRPRDARPVTVAAV